jgi:hypothetical protein
MPVSTLELFPEAQAGPRIADPIPPGLSRRQRETVKALQAIDLGRHPVTGLPLFPDAPLDASRKDRYRRWGTCGSCVHIETTVYCSTRILSCGISTSNTGGRRWYPACIQYKPDEEIIESHGLATGSD